VLNGFLADTLDRQTDTCLAAYIPGQPG